MMSRKAKPNIDRALEVVRGLTPFERAVFDETLKRLTAPPTADAPQRTRPPGRKGAKQKTTVVEVGNVGNP